MTHYRAEKESRKTQPLHIVASYARHEADYVNFLIIVERADWDVTADGLNTVRFDSPKEFVSHSDEGLRVNRRVVYEVGVPVQLPKRWQEWLMANPGKVPVGQRCGESLAGSRYRVKYEERYLEEAAKIEERRGGV